MVATIPAVVHAFLRGHILAAAEKFEVTVICNSENVGLLDGLPARLILLPIERKPSPLRDLRVLFGLFGLFRKYRFDIVHSHMPKTGLLGMMAAWMARVPVRVHTFHGEVWATRTGLRRIALKRLDTFVSLLATNILAVSQSQLGFLVSERVLPLGKALVIGAGSVCGVDPVRFHPNVEARNTIRGQMGIPMNATVILFVGRLNRDKGMLDLAMAFKSLASKNEKVVLLLVGSEEDVSVDQIRSICEAEAARIYFQSFTPAPERYMAAADIFCLPSYREGLPMTVIEAAATGLPSVASRIYGISDAVKEGGTGLLFSVGNVAELENSLWCLISDPALRGQMGLAARERALALYPSEKVIREMVSFYEHCCERH